MHTSSDELASGDEDAKRIEKAEKVAEQRAERKRKKMAGKASRSWKARRSSQPSRDTGSLPGASKTIMAVPVSQSLPRRVPGPCFHCLEMGHLKGSCPKLGKSYPLSQLASNGADCCSEGVSQVIENVKRSVKEHGIVVNESVSHTVTEHSMVLNSAVKDLGHVEMSEHECGSDRKLDPGLGRVWEVCQEEIQLVDVQGRLCKCIAFWENELKASPSSS